MTHEEMIEEARKAVHAAIPGSGPYDSWLPARSLGSDFLGDIAEAAFAVFEKAQAPTDDERDAANALAEYDRSQPSDYERAYADPLAEALRALLRRRAPGGGDER